LIEGPISQHLDAVSSPSAPFIEFLRGSAWAERISLTASDERALPRFGAVVDAVG
jgi:hypothetical protein